MRPAGNDFNYFLSRQYVGPISTEKWHCGAGPTRGGTQIGRSSRNRSWSLTAQ